MQTSTITIEVNLDEDKVPQQISWKATDSSADVAQKAKAMMLSFWDGSDKTALRIDLWTKDMMVDEMADFIYQTMVTMADTYNRRNYFHLYTCYLWERRSMVSCFIQKRT